MKSWLFPRNKKPTARYCSNGPSKAKLFFPCSADDSAARRFHFPVWVHIAVLSFVSGPQTKQVRHEWLGQYLLQSLYVPEYDQASHPLWLKAAGR